MNMNDIIYMNPIEYTPKVSNSREVFQNLVWGHNKLLEYTKDIMMNNKIDTNLLRADIINLEASIEFNKVEIAKCQSVIKDLTLLVRILAQRLDIKELSAEISIKETSNDI